MKISGLEHYTQHELEILGDAIETAFHAVPCERNCEHCANYNPCNDLDLLGNYIGRLYLSRKSADKNPKNFSEKGLTNTK